MKKFKRLLAMFLAVTLVVGIVNLPTKAADPVDFEIHEIKTGANRGSDWLFRFTTSETIPGSDFGTHMGNFPILVSDGTTESSKTGYFYTATGDGSNNGLGLIVENSYIPADATGYSFTIPKGTEIPNGGTTFRVSADAKFEYVEGVWKKATLPIEFTVDEIKTGANRGSDWLFRFTTSETIPGSDFGTHMGNFPIRVSDGTTESSKTGYFYTATGDGSNNGLGLIVENSYIPADATGYSFAILAGTEWVHQGVTYRVSADANFRYTNGAWEAYEEAGAAEAVTLSVVISRTDLLLTGVDKIATPSGDVAFEAVDANSIYQYNGAPSNMGMIMSAFGGIYSDVAGMSGKSAPDTGDIITYGGVWKYKGDGKLYDFGKQSFKWSGSAWEAYDEASEATEVTLSVVISRTDLLLAGVDKIAIPSGDVAFEAVDASSIYQYNGAPSSMGMIMSAFGGIYSDVAGMSGKSAPDTGDIITYGGVWKYKGDGKLYDFGKQSFKWSGSAWEAYDEASEATEVTLSVVISRTDLLLAGVDKIATPSGDVAFEAVDASSIYQYNGAPSNMGMIMSAFGGIYSDVASMSGKSAPDTGDTITYGGVWKYKGDGKLYDFGNQVFTWDGTAWKQGVIDDSFTITGYAGGGAQDFNNPPRWLLQFATTKAIEGTGYAAIETRDVKIKKLGGAENTVQVEYCTLGDGKLTLLIPFTELPQAAEGYVVTIPKGAIGKYELTEDYAMQYSAGEWKKFDASKEYTKFTITGLGQGGAQPDMNRWLIRLNTSAEIRGTAYVDLFSALSVKVDGADKTLEFYPNEEKGLAMILPFDVVPEAPAKGTTLIIPAGFYGDYELTKDFTMYYDNGAWNEKIDPSEVQAEKVTFDFFANRDDVLALTIDKIANTLPGEAEPTFTPVGEAKITYNGVQTNNPKMSQYGLYLAVNEMTNGAQAKAQYGDKIVISGIWKYTGDNKFYDFGTVTYRYNGGGAWEIFDPSQDIEYDMATPHVYDMFELTNISTITMKEGAQFNLADLKAASNVGLRLKVNSVPGDVIFTLSKDVANNVWVNSGYEIKLVPEVNEIRIITIEPYPDGREDEVIRARVSNMDFSKPFALEFSVADMYKKGTKQLIGRCVIAKVNGEEVIRWIDKDLNRKLGNFSAAWAAKETTIDSVGYEGYIPVDKNVGVKDFFDATGYAERRVTPNECTYLGELDSKNSALKMNVDMTKTTGEFKLAIAKKDQTTIWDIEESGYQFWFRPETNQVFIGYGMSEYATMVSHECSGNFVLEVGSKDVYHQNGKYYGYMVYVKIDGKEVTSWIDKNVNSRNMGTAIVAYGSANADVVLSSLYSKAELPVVYEINGEKVESSDFAKVQSTVVLDKPSKITVSIQQDAGYALKYLGTSVAGEELTALEIANAPIGEYTYEAIASKGDEVVIHLETRELTTDEPEKILDISEVMGVPSINVESGKEAHIGSTVGAEGRYRINTAVQMKLEIPSAFNQIRWSMFSDQSSMWGYNGFIVKLLNNKIAICYTATEYKLAEFNCDLIQPNTTLYFESGAVKCYENGNYKYDRYYVKVGKTLDSMEMACWFDSRERGSYGTTISAYGMDVPGSYTISSAADIKTIADTSTQTNKEKLATYETFDTTNYAVYYPKSVKAGEPAAIKLYPKEGKNLKSLTVAGKNVTASVTKTADGGYVYELPKVTSDIKFSYVIE